MNNDTTVALGGCLAAVMAVVMYLSLIAAVVWLVATIIHGVFF